MNVMIISRKIHRMLVVIISFLGIIMMSTGSVIKFPGVFGGIGIDIYLMREVHNIVSTFFSIAFTGMAVSGLVMFLYPKFIKR